MDKPNTYQLFVPTKIKVPSDLIARDVAISHLSVGCERPNANLQTQAPPLFQISETQQNPRIYTIKSYHRQLDNEKLVTISGIHIYSTINTDSKTTLLREEFYRLLWSPPP